ncbi:MAG: carboxypeptidase regulatory-like domain-containing protein [Elusimicrobia bacterium]|nr:carboxypeptidase regulatory-like domain-containing protein [Elusimicrobiota bacterium]
MTKVFKGKTSAWGRVLRTGLTVLSSLFAASALFANTATLTVTVDYSGNQTGNLIVIISADRITDPRTPFTGMWDYEAVPNPGPSTDVTFTVPDGTYYVYAFLDADNGVDIDGTEPMGGLGPFPYQAGEAEQPVNVSGTASCDIELRDRASITGTVETAVWNGNPMVRAVPLSAPTDTTKSWTADVTFSAVNSAGSFSLGGLLASASYSSYTVTAWLDKMDNTGQYNEVPDGYELSSSSTPVAVSSGARTSGVSLTFSSGTGTGYHEGGSPANIRMMDDLGNNYQILPAGSASNELTVSIVDMFGLPTSTSANVTVSFNAYKDDGTSASFALSSDDFSTAFSNLTIAGGDSESASFKFKTSATGRIRLEAQASDFPNTGESRRAMYLFEVLSAGAGFSNVTIRTNSEAAPVTGRTSVTISPNYDGKNDAAVFSCTPPDSSQWELLIASVPTTSALFNSSIIGRMNGWGTGDVYWYGEDESNDRRTVPNGTYYVRFQASGGGIKNDSLSVTVESSYISGRVLSGGTPQGDVEVNVWGQGGGGYTRSRADGTFFVGGLTTGLSYTVNLQKSGLSSKQVQNVSANTNMGDVSLDQGATLNVRATVDRAPTYDIWGGVFVHDANYQNTAWGGLHIASGATTSDNGYPSNDPSSSTWSSIGVMPNTAYTLEVHLPEFGQEHQTVTSPAGGSASNVTLTFTRKANIYGRITLPSAPNTAYGGEWIGVDALKAGDEFPTAWGGVFLNSNQTTGIYAINGVGPGTYQLRSFVRGYKTQTLSVTVSGTTDVGTASGGGADFPPFAEGGRVTGTVKVAGDSTGVTTENQFGCANCGGASGFDVYVNAWSPTTFSGSFAQVNLAKNATETSASYALTGLDDGTYHVFTWLPGFELDPPGPKRATVSGGSGSLDLTFRALSGRIDLTVLLPAGDNPALVTYVVRAEHFGDTEKNGSFGASGTASVTGLGTGLYRVVVVNRNPGRGLRKDTGISVTNGRASSLTMDMTERTYTISGTIAFSGSFALPGKWNGVTVSSAAGLQAAESTAPGVQIYKFPLPEHFYGKSVSPLQQKLATPVAASAGTGATFVIRGIPAGTYLLRVQDDLDPPDFQGFGMEQGVQPEFATTNKVVYVTDGNVSDAALTISNGVKLSGTISRPSGDTSTDARNFRLILRRSDNLAVVQSSATTTGAGTASYSIKHLAEGEYILEVHEDTSSTTPKYAAVPKRITVGNSDLTQNITLVRSGIIVGKLRDADSKNLITKNNKSQYLSDGFEVFAHANPWTPGGHAQVDWEERGGGIKISSATGQFTVYRLVPGTYDVSFRTFGNMDMKSLANGTKAYTPVVKSGITVSEGQTVDLGVIDLNQGVNITGRVTDVSGTALPAIRVVGRPSVAEGERGFEMSVEALTDADGKYELQGVDRNEEFYDVIAAPRFQWDDIFKDLSGTKYGEEKNRMIDVQDDTARQGVDFALTEANGILTGKAATADGGALEDPFSEGSFSQRQARVVLHRDGEEMGDNPIGEIEEVTDPQGNFRISALKPGSYEVRVLSLGYVTARKNVIVEAGENNTGTITLERGATVSGNITKPNGSNPSTSEIDFIVGVDEDFQEFVFGKVEENSSANTVTGYKMTGFKTGLDYSIIVGNHGDDLLELKTGLSFSASTETKTVNLIYRPSPPIVFTTQARSGTTMTITFFSSHKMRNLTADDNDLTKIVTLTSGAGTVTKRTLSASRDTLKVVYSIPANEAKFKMKLAFTSIQVDADSETGANFTFSQEFEFFAAASRMRRVKIANAMGGSNVLEGDPTGINFGPGGFQVERSSRVEVGVVSASDLGTLSSGASPAGSAARALGVAAAAERLGPAAYPSESLYKAARLAPSVSPFSAFYDIFLPAGVSHMLKKEALLTLQYDATVTDPSKINIYYFDDGNNVFLLESTKRKVDTKNRTITVAVNHASTFVVLQNNAPIVGANTYTGREILLHNFPNPFNLKTKTVSLTNSPSSPTQSIEGTMIKYALPSAKSGTVKIEIYNMAGELVRTITESASSGGTYYYTPWDGKNDGGKKVASGVYVVRFTLNGGDEKFFKMAVLK